MVLEKSDARFTHDRMNARARLPALLIIICLGTIGIVAQHRQLTTLRENKNRIQTPISQQPEQSSPSPYPSMPSTAPSPELLALRSQITQLTQRSNELAGVRVENEGLHSQLAARGTNSSGTVSLPPGYIRRTQAQWVGMSTPENTLQSFLWAVQNHDFTNVLQVLTPGSAQQFLREKGNSPEEFFLDASSIPGLRIVSKQQEGTTIIAQLEFVPGQVIPDAWHFQLIDGNWKMETR